MTIITPYRISVADAVLADLKARLRNTRRPEGTRRARAKIATPRAYRERRDRPPTR
jgi:hypothetical protein